MGETLSQTQPDVEKTQSTRYPAQLAVGHTEAPPGSLVWPHPHLGQQLHSEQKFCTGAQGHNVCEDL